MGIQHSMYLWWITVRILPLCTPIAQRNNERLSWGVIGNGPGTVGMYELLGLVLDALSYYSIAHVCYAELGPLTGHFIAVNLPVKSLQFDVCSRQVLRARDPDSGSASRSSNPRRPRPVSAGVLGADDPRRLASLPRRSRGWPPGPQRARTSSPSPSAQSPFPLPRLPRRSPDCSLRQYSVPRRALDGRGACAVWYGHTGQ